MKTDQLPAQLYTIMVIPFALNVMYFFLCFWHCMINLLIIEVGSGSLVVPREHGWFSKKNKKHTLEH